MLFGPELPPVIGRSQSARVFLGASIPVHALRKAECIRAIIFYDWPYKTVIGFESAAAGWVDWFNNLRLPSSLGSVPPAAFEQAHYAALTPKGAAEDLKRLLNLIYGSVAFR